MLFNNNDDGSIECIDWCDIEEDERVVGVISKSDEDGYYRLMVTSKTPLACCSLKSTAKKVSEMNGGKLTNVVFTDLTNSSNSIRVADIKDFTFITTVPNKKGA